MPSDGHLCTVEGAHIAGIIVFVVFLDDGAGVAGLEGNKPLRVQAHVACWNVVDLRGQTYEPERLRRMPMLGEVRPNSVDFAQGLLRQTQGLGRCGTARLHIPRDSTGSTQRASHLTVRFPGLTVSWLTATVGPLDAAALMAPVAIEGADTANLQTAACEEQLCR